jgi:HD-like signal output (HDOD) protein
MEDEEYLDVRALSQTDEATAIPWAHFRVPPFPQIALHVLKSANNDGMSMCHISDLISSDPAFCSEVLTIANSAAVPHRFPVTSILQAIALLGTNNLKGLCLTVAVRGYLGKPMAHGTLRGIWLHSLATAFIAQQLVLVGLIDDDTAYTAGLLHEIGRLALAVLRPTDYAMLLETHRGSATTILQHEREMFGLDHREMGLHLVTEWKLPVEFDAVVSQQNPARLSSVRLNLADLIHISCRMADAAGFPTFPGCEVTPYQDLLDELPSSERSRFYSDINDLAFEIAKQINVIDSLSTDTERQHQNDNTDRRHVTSGFANRAVLVSESAPRPPMLRFALHCLHRLGSFLNSLS